MTFKELKRFLKLQLEHLRLDIFLTFSSGFLGSFSYKNFSYEKTYFEETIFTVKFLLLNVSSISATAIVLF